MVLEDATVQEHLNETGEIPRGREETGMGRDPAESKSVLVMDLAANQSTPPGVVLRGGYPRQAIITRSEEGVGHRQRLENPLPNELFQRLPGDSGQDLAQKNDAEVAVLVIGPRLVDQLHLLNALEILLGALKLFVERGPPVDAGAVGEQVTDGDLLLARALEERQEVLHLCLEIEAPLVDHDHRHGGRGDHLGQTGQVVDRVLFDLRCILVVGEPAEGMDVNQGSTMPDGHDATGKGPLLDELLEHTVHLCHASRLEPRIFRRGGTKSHGAARDLDALAVGVSFGEGDRQSAPNIDLAKERADRRVATRLRGSKGTEICGNLGKLGQEVRAAEGCDDHRHVRLREPPQEPEQAVRDRLSIKRGRHQDVREVSRGLQNLVRPLLHDLVTQRNGLDHDPPSPELLGGKTEVVGHDEMEDPERIFGLERQEIPVVPDHGDGRLGDPHRPAKILRPADFASTGLRVDQTISIETEPGFGLQDAPHRPVDTLFVELSLLDTAEERLEGYPKVGRHQDHIGAGANRVHRRLADPGRSDALHNHGVGHDETLKTHLVAQDIRVEGGRECCGTAGRVEGRHRHVTHHDRVHPGRDRLSEWRPFHHFKMFAVDADDRKLQVAVDGGVAVPRKMFGRRQHAAAAGALDKGDTEPGDQLRVLAKRPQVDHRVVRIVIDIDHRSKGPVDAQRPPFPGRHLSEKAGRFLGARGAHGHRVGQIDRSPTETKGQAALQIHRYQERYPGLTLELVEQTGDGPLLRPQEDQTPHSVVPDRLHELEVGLRPRIPGVAGLRDHDHLGHFLFQAHGGHGLPHPAFLGRRQLRSTRLLPEAGDGGDENDESQCDETALETPDDVSSR